MYLDNINFAELVNIKVVGFGKINKRTKILDVRVILHKKLLM